MVFTAVVYHAKAHLIPFCHREHGNAGAVKQRAKPVLRVQPQGIRLAWRRRVFGCAGFLWHIVSPQGYCLQPGGFYAAEAGQAKFAILKFYLSNRAVAPPATKSGFGMSGKILAVQKRKNKSENLKIRLANKLGTAVLLLQGSAVLCRLCPAVLCFWHRSLGKRFPRSWKAVILGYKTISGAVNICKRPSRLSWRRLGEILLTCGILPAIMGAI